jgi:hypothetical protein
MTQALPVVQTTHAKEPKFIIPEKFDGTQSKFCGFVQQINLFLRLHPSHYPDDSMQVAFIAHCYQGMPFFGLYHYWKSIRRFYKTWLNLRPSLPLHLVIVIGRG